MNGLGRVWVLLGAAVFVAAGCGGRTGALDDGFDDPDGGSSNGAVGNGGAGNVAGRVSSGGATIGGNVNRAGASYGGAYAGGAFPGGSYTGGAYTAGAYSGGGYAGGYAGDGFGGSFGGTFGNAGAFPVGGFSGAPPIDCQSCIYKTCGGAFAQCFQDFGCLSIFGCTQATGCQAFDCYQPQTCGPIIDQWGGPAGSSMSSLLQAFGCAIQSGCPCN